MYICTRGRLQVFESNGSNDTNDSSDCRDSSGSRIGSSDSYDSSDNSDSNDTKYIRDNSDSNASSDNNEGSDNRDSNDTRDSRDNNDCTVVPVNQYQGLATGVSPERGYMGSHDKENVGPLFFSFLKDHNISRIPCSLPL